MIIGAGVVLAERFVVMLAFGVVLFIGSVLARTSMNIKIGQAQSGNPTTRSTEIRYLRLVRSKGASLWPLIIAVVLIPLGIVLTFGAIIVNNRFTAK